MPKILKKKKTASEIVAAARGLKKVTANELIDGIFDDFFESIFEGSSKIIET